MEGALGRVRRPRRSLVERLDRPAAGAMLVGEREPRSGVSTSNRVRGPVIDGNAAASSRTAASRVTGSRSSPQVISRGRPSNQPVRTWTSTGSTLIIAIVAAPFGGSLGCASVVAGTSVTERLFGSDAILHRTAVRCQASSTRSPRPP